MQKVLQRRVWRSLKKHAVRYAALGLLIIFGMYIVVSLVAAADTVITGTEQTAQELSREDGQFAVMTKLSSAQEEELTQLGITLEQMFYLDFLMEDDSTLRIYQNREQINLLQLVEGKAAKNEDEIVLEKRYAESCQYQVGDEITVADRAYLISGIGCVPDYEAPLKEFSDSVVDSAGFGLGFVTKEAYNQARTLKSSKAESLYYAYRLQGELSDEELKEQIKAFKILPTEVEDIYFQAYWEETGGKKDEIADGIDDLTQGAKDLFDGLEELEEHNADLTALSAYGIDLSEYTKGVQELAEGAKELKEGTDELQERSTELLDEIDTTLDNMTMFLKQEDNPRIGAATDDQAINKLCGIFAGVIVMILFTYVISVFVIHGIEKESSTIGALYALGVKQKDLIRHYLQLPITITVIAGLIGTILGFSYVGAPQQLMSTYAYYSIANLPMQYSLSLILYSVLMPPVVAWIVNYFVIRKALSRPVLGLLKEEQKENKVVDINLGNMGFVRRFQIRQMLRELRSAVTVIFGMFVSLLILMLALNCATLCIHIKTETAEDIKYEYMYTYKYPQTTVPKDGEPAFAKTLKREIYGYNLEVTLLGIQEDNPYFDVNCEEGENLVVLSSAASQKYGLTTGDDIILKDEEQGRNYAFTITGVTQYAPGLFVFMDIDSMRALFGEKEEYYNVVFSDKDLEIPTGNLYAVTNRSELVHSAGVFVDSMKSMVMVLSFGAAFIFFVVMYLMLKVMVDRSVYSISLAKVFGFKNREIRKLYLNGNFYIIVLGAVITIPLAKKMMDMMYPILISNVATGMNLKFEWQLYAAILGGIIILYLVINQLLLGKVKRIIPAEVLKNKE